MPSPAQKPCPFCGEPPEIVAYEKTINGHLYQTVAVNCDCDEYRKRIGYSDTVNGGGGITTQELLAREEAAWNRRAGEQKEGETK